MSRCSLASVIGGELLVSLSTVASHRGVRLVPLADSLDGFAALAQSRWAVWRRKHALGDRTPSAFDDLLTEVQAFADPALNGEVSDMRWDPSKTTWL